MTIFMHTTELFLVGERDREMGNRGDREKEDKKGRDTAEENR